MKRVSLILALMLVVAMTLMITACGTTEPTTSPEPAPTETTTETPDGQMDDRTIVAVAEESGEFNTLLAALEAAGLAETLEGPGPFTVFAPDDAAFEALPEGTVDTLLQDPQGDLTQILTYHVVSGDYPAASLTDGMTLTSLQGSDITIEIRDGNVYANNSMVKTPDVAASNGTIHVIDSVMSPPEQ